MVSVHEELYLTDGEPNDTEEMEPRVYVHTIEILGFSTPKADGMWQHALRTIPKVPEVKIERLQSGATLE